MRILIAGQKFFGAEVFRRARSICDVEIAAVSAPAGQEQEDKLFALASIYGVQIIPAGSLKASTMPDGIDLIVTAHSHDFISEKTRLRATHGGIGYHPSLLPLHRGRDAIRWCVRMGEKITGGTVYRLSNKMDGGNVLEQKLVFIEREETAAELWRKKLCPLGVDLLCQSIEKHARFGYQHGEPQEEKYATWEPSIDRPPAYRPDLVLLPWKEGAIK